MYSRLWFLGHSNSRQTDPAVLVVALLACITVCSSQDFTSNPQNATVSEGETLILACVTGPGLAGQTVFWKRGGGVLFPLSNYPTYSTEGDASVGDYSLTIQNVSLEEDNSWSCQVSGTESSTAYVIVQVFENPALSIGPLTDGEEVTLIEGERLIFDGVVSFANPPADIACFISSMGTTVPVDDSNFESPEPIRSGDPSGKLWNTTSTLNMTVQSNDNEAEIICRANHITLSNPIQVTVTLNVQFQPVPPTVALVDVTVDILDGSITVSVDVEGNPEPVVTWVSEGHSNKTGDSLIITRDMAGEYNCWASNNIGEVSCGTFTVTGTVWKLVLLVVALIVLVGAGVGVGIYCICKKKSAVSQDLTAARSPTQVELEQQAAEKNDAKSKEPLTKEKEEHK